MGISGLLPALKSIHKTQHIKSWAGKTVVVDAYGWLHRGTVSCAVDLALGKPTTKYVEFAMGRVKMLLHFGVTPYIVFDGDYLPSKAGEEAGRALRREASRKTGLDLLRQGKSTQAHLELQKAVDVTPQMARNFIDALKASNISYVVAPYEADAQMYYLEQQGIVDAIVSEDSDLLVFGCKNLITKLSQFGECVHICRDDFPKCRELSLAGWSDREFRAMAILSGCDYLENIPRMGLKTAHRLVRKHKDIEKILRAMRFDAQYTIPANYLDGFRQADLTFLHQRVYCPRQRKMVMCTPPEKELSDEDLIFIGPEIDEELAQGVANGDLDPMTKQPLVGTVPRMAKHHPGKAFALNASSSHSYHTHAHTHTPTKPTQTIQSFFKPRTPLQEKEQNKIASPHTPKPSLSTTCTQDFSNLLSSTDFKSQTKRSTAETGNEENFQTVKKAKVSGDTADLETSPSKPLGEERSKFFATPKHRLARRSLDTAKGSPVTPAAERLLQKRTPMKENVAPLQRTPTSTTGVFEETADGKESIATTVISPTTSAAIEEFEPASDEFPQNKVIEEETNPAQEKPNEDVVIQKITQGWRERYAFSSPPAGMKSPCAYQKPSQRPISNSPSKSSSFASSSSSTTSTTSATSTPSAKLTPLQRIGSNALNRPGPKGLAKVPPAQPFLKGLPQQRPGAAQSTSSPTADNRTVGTAKLLDRFRYTGH